MGSKANSRHLNGTQHRGGTSEAILTDDPLLIGIGKIKG